MISNIVFNSLDLIFRVLTIAVCFIDPALHFYGVFLLLILWIPSFVITSTAFYCWKPQRRILLYVLTFLLPYPFLQIIVSMKNLDETLFMEAVEYRILDLKYFLQLNIVSSSLQASTLVISILKGDLATTGKNLFWLQIKINIIFFRINIWSSCNHIYPHVLLFNTWELYWITARRG